MLSEAMKLFTGVICVLTRDDLGGITQSNEVWTLWARSLDEAIGCASRQSLAKHPNGSIVYQGMYDITDVAQNKPEATHD